ncbi:CysZ protein [Microbacterium sp. cf046]|uniref:EI24 domain-containing protein n=1 Tax=Microbacterium sp. cf046 TaxID=1761803 RepID=UPI0008E7D097|nr:EI24 domain-containing protein [Microbacterium sp. cf046]SFS09326.1 CysZ protein [Microbacterium sp. cf046]
MREFVVGVGLLGRGFASWRRRPGLMALGLIPAAIVGLLLLSGIVTLAITLPGITVAVTPFADGWPSLWATVIRATIGTAMVGAALVLAAVSFTALTLIVGEPFYERIWRSVERDLGDADIDAGYGFWRSVRDGLFLFVRGVAIAVLAALIGFIPVVGGVLATVFAVVLTGWLLADELSSRALTARGIDYEGRRRLMRSHRGRVLGFGVATQLCFMIPFGAVATMPAAVAGSTNLARSLLEPRRVEAG